MSLPKSDPLRDELTFANGIKGALFGNTVMAAIFGMFEGFRAKENAVRDNKETLLMHENYQLREQLNQAGEMLNQTGSYLLQAGKPAGSHTEKALADKAAAADSKHSVV